jgi:hypothetical protein
MVRHDDIAFSPLVRGEVMIRAFVARVLGWMNPKCNECGKRIGSTKGCTECGELNADTQAYRF